MAIDISKGVFVSDGCVLRKDVVVLAAGFNTDPDQETSRVIYILEGDWCHFDVEVDAVISVAADHNTAYIVAANGSAFELPLPPEAVFETIDDRIRAWVIEDVVDHGELTRVRMIGGSPYCCGQAGQIYQLSRNRWVRADHGLRSDEGPDLEDIDGIDGSEMYAVGTGGAMVRFDGKKWRFVELPTNLNLSNIRCGGDGICYACGDDGLILRGRGQEWELVGDPVSGKNYWGLEIFDGILYLAHGNGVDRLVDGEVQSMPIDLKGRKTFHRLHAGDGQLWSFGTDHVLKWEENRWTEVKIPAKP